MTAWSGSNRRDQLPRDWPRIRRRILKRDPICVCPGCKHHPLLCPMPSTDVDHIEAGNDHRACNLRGLCGPCHAVKSSLEGITARGYGPNRYRPRETHPGQR